VWGLSYAALNIANQALPTSVLVGAAVRTARSRTIIPVGPTASLVLGAFLAQWAGPRPVFALLTLVAMLAPVFAARLPDHREPIAKRTARIGWPSPISIWSFSMGFTIDGIFIFGLGLLAAASYPKGAVVAAGLSMALRYAAEVLFSQGGRVLAQRMGARLALVCVSLLVAGALLLLSSSGMWIWAGVIVVIILRAFAGPLTPPLIAEAYPGPDRVPALARQASWRDIGAGTGPLAAGFLFVSTPLLAIYGATACMLVIASLLLLRSDEGMARRASER
jgi:predicted MFS family arabinose efflux permease